MKKWFHKMKLSRQLVLISCLCTLIPTLMLWGTMLHSLWDTAVRTRQQEARLRCSQVENQAEQTAELCNMSTQVFLNTPDLIEHLTDLKQGKELSSMELLTFYREDIVSLERIIQGNPYLYQIRVYALERDIYEMMPILYSADRMGRMPWADGEFASGAWYLDFSDQLFPDYPVTPHVMSLVTGIESAEAGQVGVLEVAVRMDEVMPGLFEADGDSWAVLMSEGGEILAGSTPVDPELLQEIPFSEEAQVTTLHGERVLVTQAALWDFGCRYVQVTGLSDIDDVVFRQAALLLFAMLAVCALITFAVSRLTKRVLRGFYGAFDGIRAFAGGDTEATVAVTGTGEVADFAREAGRLLDQIRKLMHDNLEREIQAQNSEIRALQNQINAHFIYNVLEAIKMMAEIDEKYDIADAVASLGKLLRYSMKWESRNVRLDRELDYIKNYIALMNLRFDYVISLRIEVPPELLSQRLPKISLQPIVENAVVHGGAVLAADTVISLTGTLDREKRRYTLCITDEGKGMDEETLVRLRRQIAGQEPTAATAGNGIGLHNVHDRICRSFGTEYGLSVTSQLGQGTTVTVTLPYTEETGVTQ